MFLYKIMVWVIGEKGLVWHKKVKVLRRHIDFLTFLTLLNVAFGDTNSSETFLTKPDVIRHQAQMRWSKLSSSTFTKTRSARWFSRLSNILHIVYEYDVHFHLQVAPIAVQVGLIVHDPWPNPPSVLVWFLVLGSIRPFQRWSLSHCIHPKRDRHKWWLTPSVMWGI